jgi:hypothetical protein
VKDNIGFGVDIDGLEIKTAWNLSAGIAVNKMDLMYPNGEKFAQVNNMQFRVSLIPILFDKFKIDKIEADKVIAELKTDRNGNFLLQKYLEQKLKEVKPEQKYSIKFSDKMPQIIAHKYRLSVIDYYGSKYSIKGSDFDVDDFVLNKKIRVKTKGHLILKDRKQISYDVKLASSVLETQKNAQKQNSDLFKILQDLYNYNVRANIIADLKLSGDAQNPNMDGKVNVDDVSFVFGGVTFPKSNIDLLFKGDKVNIDSNLYTDVDSKAVISGVLKNGKHKFIDLSVESDKISLPNAVFLANTVSKLFGKKDLGIDAKGLLKANFNIRSDFKRVESDGYLKIKDASVTNKEYKVTLNAINADVDFSQDAVKINKATAKLYSQPITITGIVDKNANANVTVMANKLQLKGVLLASGNEKILRDNDILSGLVDVKAIVKGRLDKVQPKIDVAVSNINLKNKQSKSQIKIAKALFNTDCKIKNQGVIKLSNLKIIPSAPVTIYSPMFNLVLKNNEVDLSNNYLLINNIKANLSGKVVDINRVPKLESVVVSVPNNFSVPIAGYAGSKLTAKGSVSLSGDIKTPEIKGQFLLPLVKIPQTSTYVRNATVKFDKEYSLNCPFVQVADSQMGFSALINKDFSHGIVAKNVKFVSQSVDLNTILPVLKMLPKGQNSGLTILNGTSSVAKFKVARLTSSDITSTVKMTNNVLHLGTLRGNAYLGKIGGDISYDLNKRKTYLHLQGRGLTSNQAMVAMTGRDDDIHGILDFDSDISFVGYSKNEIMKSLSGYVNFMISNGKMGMLGKFEHLLYAQNVLSNNFFKASLGVIAKAVTVKNTGVYKYMRGKLTFSDGWAHISTLKTSGPSMSSR